MDAVGKWNRWWIKSSGGFAYAAVDVLRADGLQVDIRPSGQDTHVAILGPTGQPIGRGHVRVSVLRGCVIVEGGREYDPVNPGARAANVELAPNDVPSDYNGNEVTLVFTLASWPAEGVTITFSDALFKNGGILPPGA